MMNQCQRSTNSGKRCKNKAKEGFMFCHLHINAKPYSKIQIKWIKEVENKHHIRIRHALSSKSKSIHLACRSCGHCNDCRGGEYYIQGVGKVDGYCKKTNTVYEFHGDYWHGNPKIYPSNELHPILGCTYSELYRRTLERDNLIRSMGYNLVTMWESEYK